MIQSLGINCAALFSKAGLQCTGTFLVALPDNICRDPFIAGIYTYIAVIHVLP
jgi:hypothetical protein